VEANGVKTSRIPYLLDNRLTDGGEVVSLRRRPPFTPKKIPGTHLYWALFMCVLGSVSEASTDKLLENFKIYEEKKKEKEKSLEINFGLVRRQEAIAPLFLFWKVS
jgi:hypothetical protein